jgi:hypothetical protein
VVRPQEAYSALVTPAASYRSCGLVGRASLHPVPSLCVPRCSTRTRCIWQVATTGTSRPLRGGGAPWAPPPTSQETARQTRRKCRASSIAQQLAEETYTTTTACSCGGGRVPRTDVYMKHWRTRRKTPCVPVLRVTVPLPDTVRADVFTGNALRMCFIESS